jgi:hypothetical protein
MVLPLLFSALAPTLFGGTALGATLGPAALSAIGAGLGGVAETGDLEKGLLTGLGAFAGGALLGPVLGGAGGAGADAATAAATSSPVIPVSPLPAFNPAINSAAELAASNAAQAATAAPTGIKGLMGSAMDFAKSPVGIGSTVGAMAGSALGPLFDKGDDKKPKGSGGKEMVPIPRGVQFPGADYQPGVSGEFDYGFGGPPSSAEILAYRDANPYKFAGGGLLQSLQRTFGPIKLAEGGIAALLGGGGEGQFAAAAPVGGNEKDVVVEAVRAIKGQSPSPEIALGAFLAQYGEDALRQLVDKVQSGELDETVARGEGQMRGPGDGMDDLIPASIEGEQDVLLSDGEFVVPADVVSSLGNGSSDAGARALEDMMRRIREMKNGSPEQPPQVPQGEMLPV